MRPTCDGSTKAVMRKVSICVPLSDQLIPCLEKASLQGFRFNHVCVWEVEGGRIMWGNVEGKPNKGESAHMAGIVDSMLDSACEWRCWVWNNDGECSIAVKRCCSESSWERHEKTFWVPTWDGNITWLPKWHSNKISRQYSTSVQSMQGNKVPVPSISFAENIWKSKLTYDYRLTKHSI